jgi:HSP20 family protein
MKFLFQTNRPNDDDGKGESEEVEEGRQSVRSSQQDEWLEEDGQLSVDVYQTKDNIVIKSTIAGVKPEDIDISINNDMITIRGSRHQEFEIDKEDFFLSRMLLGKFFSFYYFAS